MVVNIVTVIPKLSKAAVQLREQIDDSFPDRDRHSDGWLGDARHAVRPSDHNPDAVSGWVRAIDVDANLNKSKETSSYLSDQLRLFAKRNKRITYIIHNGMIASPKLFWKWRKYTGINKHEHHIHISFAKTEDSNSEFFNIPMIGGTDA